MRVARCLRVLGRVLSCLLLVSAGCTSESAPTVSDSRGASAAVESSAVSPAVAAGGENAASTEQAAQSAAADAEKQPVPGTSNQAKTPVAQVTPATVQDAVKVLDLSTLPKLNETRAMSNRPTVVEYFAKGKVQSAVAFYRAELAGLGWKELTPAPDAAAALQYHEAIFGKDGYYLKAMVGESGDEGEVSINLNMLGNIDARALPVVENATSMNSGVPSSASYLCTGELAAVASECRDLLLEHGWKEYHQFAPFNRQTPNFVDMSWVQNGVVLFAYVSSTPQYQNGQPTLSYHLTGMLPFDMPIIADAIELKLEGASSRFEYDSPSDISAIAAFYEEAYPKLGWTRRSEGSTGPGGASLIFEQGKLTGLVQVTPPAEGETGNRVSFQLISLESDAEPETVAGTPTPGDAPGSESPSVPAQPSVPAIGIDISNEVDAEVREALKAAQSEINNALKGINAPGGTKIPIPTIPLDPDEPEAPAAQGKGIAAEEFPLPPGSEKVSRDAGRKAITFEHADSGEVLKEFFAEQLESREWHLGSTVKSTINGAVSFNLGFYKDERELSIEMAQVPPANSSRVTISGDGLAFSGSAPQPQPAAAGLEAEERDGLPIPKDHTSYASSKTRFRRELTVAVPASFDAVLAFYNAELPKAGWKLSAGKPDANAKTADLTFAKKDDRLQIKLRMVEDEAEVVLTTRDDKAAKDAGILPQPGKARLIMGNAAEKDVVIDINGTPYTIKAGTGAENPADGKSISPLPGKYKVTIKFPGQSDESEELTLGAEETWGVIVLPNGGFFADRVY